MGNHFGRDDRNTGCRCERFPGVRCAGVRVKVRISGIRKVEWQKDPPNFIFVFPAGVLNEAPQIYVASTRIDEPAVASRFQQQLVASFPNVSLIDLRLVLSTVKEFFDKVGSIVRILALFSLAAGVVVLAGMVLATRFVRQREYALMRTLGASSRFIAGITLIEYGYVGIFSVAAGAGLSLAAGYALAVLFLIFSFLSGWPNWLPWPARWYCLQWQWDGSTRAVCAARHPWKCCENNISSTGY